MSEETKICSECTIEKPLSMFYKRSDSKDGRYKQCIACRNAMAKPKSEATKAKNAARQRVNQRRELTHDDLTSQLNYDPQTGAFTWVITKGKAKAGGVAGTVAKVPHRTAQYLIMKVNGRVFHLHRLAWFYMTGEWPEQVDHINGDGLDNSWLNLRDVSGFENQQNIPLRAKNRSGIHGVNWIERNGSYFTSIGANGQSHYLGQFKDFFEACCARKSAENFYGFHPNHGRTA